MRFTVVRVRPEAPRLHRSGRQLAPLTRAILDTEQNGGAVRCALYGQSPVNLRKSVENSMRRLGYRSRSRYFAEDHEIYFWSERA